MPADIEPYSEKGNAHFKAVYLEGPQASYYCEEMEGHVQTANISNYHDEA